MTIGEKIRDARTSQSFSLTVLSEKLNVSAATLSRIENGKQSLDLGLFLLLAKALHRQPQDLLTETDTVDDEEGLVGRIAGLDARGRTQLWRDLSATRKSARLHARPARDLIADVEELLAQVEFLRDEITDMHTRLRKR